MRLCLHIYAAGECALTILLSFCYNYNHAVAGSKYIILTFPMDQSEARIYGIRSTKLHWCSCQVLLNNVMIMLVLAVLFFHHATHCAARDDPGTYPLFTHLDQILHQTVFSSPRDNFINSMLSVSKSINTSYAACLVTSKQQWENLHEKSHFPNICGSIGYTEAEPVSITWTVQTNFGVLLNVTYLNIPFLDLQCPFARLFIGSVVTTKICGHRSNWVIFDPTNITVHLQQDITLPGSTGFVATYVAEITRDNKALGVAYTMFEIDGHWSNTSTPMLDYVNKYHETKCSWHVVVTFNRVIEFSIESSDEYLIYDGPGPLSPVLRNAKQSTAFHLYIVQQSPNLFLQYTSLEQTSFSTQNHVVLSSHPNRNVVYGYQVRGGGKALRISFLSIHSHDFFLKEFPSKCLFGGLFVYNNRMVLNVCQTKWKEEVLIHLTDKRFPDDLHMVIFVALYGSYIDGTVALSIKSTMESCYPRNPIADPSKFQIYEGCNQFVYRLTYFNYMSKNVDLARSGPVDIKVHILPLMHDVYKIQLNITVSDSNILGLNRTTYTDIVGTQAKLSYQNPNQFVLHEIQGNELSTWRIAIIQFIRKALCDFGHAYRNRYLSLPATQIVTLYPYHARCQCSVDGHTQYNVDIVSTAINIYVVIVFNGSKCASDCQHSNVTFTEYNMQFDTLIVHSFTSIPLLWDNVHSNNSVKIHIAVDNDCKSCALWVFVKPGFRANYQQTFRSSSLVSEVIKTKRMIFPAR